MSKSLSINNTQREQTVFERHVTQNNSRQGVTKISSRRRGIWFAVSLPADVLADAVERIQWFSLTVLCASMSALIASWIFPIQLAPESLRIALYLPLSIVSISLCLVARWQVLSPEALVDFALGYKVLGAAVLALITNAGTWPTHIELLSWSPVAVWTLIFPLVVPSSTGRTLLSSVLALSMDPLSVWFLVRLGAIPPPATLIVILRFLPSLPVLMMSVFISRLVHQLGSKLSKARQLGSYRLVERLGSGGMGEVWKATHRMLARPAAVKLIRPAALQDNVTTFGNVQKRFEREAQATAALRSPHTVGIFDFGVARDGAFYYVMELLDGMDLDSLVQLDGAQPPERVVHLLRQACHSLHEAHLAGLVHRDIKPANLFVCRYGADLDFVKVLDFGLVAEQARGPEEMALTAQHSLAGTPAYMAPEMAKGQREVDGRADVYALGCVAYWLLTAKPVFEADTVLGMLMSHLTEVPVRPSVRANRPVPPELEDIVLACLEKDPLRRPSSARELSDRLAALGLEAAWTERRASEWWDEVGPARKGAAVKTAPIVA